MSALSRYRNGAQKKSLPAFHGPSVGGGPDVSARKYLSHRDDSDRPEADFLYSPGRRDRSGQIGSARFGGARIHRQFYNSLAQNARIGVVRVFGFVRLVPIPR